MVESAGFPVFIIKRMIARKRDPDSHIKRYNAESGQVPPGHFIEKGETLISKYEILNADLWSRILAKRDNFKNPMLKIQNWFDLELDIWRLVLEFCQ